MWLGEQVNEFGVGNGISIILFAGILSRVPNMVTMCASYIASKGSIGYLWIALLIVGILAMIVLIVHVNEAERRIPVQYAKRQVGRKMYGGQASTLPMKVNMSGVLPIIFAQSIASLPATIWAFARGGYRRPQHLQCDRHQVCAVSDRLLRDDHRLQLFLRDHSVQPH